MEKIMKEAEYFCTKCKKDVEPNNIHMNYGFVRWYKFKSDSLYKNIKMVKNKHLCICKRCFFFGVVK